MLRMTCLLTLDKSHALSVYLHFFRRTCFCSLLSLAMSHEWNKDKSTLFVYLVFVHLFKWCMYPSIPEYRGTWL